MDGALEARAAAQGEEDRRILSQDQTGADPPKGGSAGEVRVGAKGPKGTPSAGKQAGAIGPKGASTAGAVAKVEDLPEEARKIIGQMLAEGGCTYEQIAQALSEAGFCIAKGAIGRHDARKADERRQNALFRKQLDGLRRLMAKDDGFDMAGSALPLLMGKLCERLASDGGLFDEMSADRATAGLIQAARAAIQYEKTAGERKKLRAAVRAEVIEELRETLKRAPELWEQIEALVARGSGR